MSLEADLRAFVLADPAIAAKVGQRMHLNAVPETSELPAIVYWVVDIVPTHMITRKSPLDRYRIQVGVRANRATDAVEISKMIRDRLEFHTGATGSGTVDRILYLGRAPGDWDPQLESHADDHDYAVWAVP